MDKADKVRIAAFDPSLRSTGVWIGGGRFMSYNGVIAPRCARLEALAEIMQSVERALCVYGPVDLCVVEGYAFGAQGNALTVQAEVGGVIRAVCKIRGNRVTEVAPMLWQSVMMNRRLTGVTSKIKRNRRLYLSMVEKHHGEVFGTTDEADAWMMAEFIRRVLRGEAGNTEAVRQLYGFLVGECKLSPERILL